MSGNVGPSTFRQTISAIFHEPLRPHAVKPDSLALESNRRASEWIKGHLRIAIAPWGDRTSLLRLEKVVLERLDPPFNLNGRPVCACREQLEKLRKVIAQG